MKALKDKIKVECMTSLSLTEKAWHSDYKKSVELRKEQQYHWDKFQFMKNLDKELSKREKISPVSNSIQAKSKISKRKSDANES